jgi:hypothetical protein
MNFVIYFLLTCGLSIWQGSFSYKDMTTCFGNLLVLQGSLMGYDNLFWESSSSTRIFNGLQGLVNVSKPFSYKDSLFILPTTRKEDFRINSTFIFDYPNLYGTSKGQQI